MTTQATGQISGGELVAQALRVAGVEAVFGIISIHNLPIYDAIGREGIIRAIINRSEPGAVNMADGYARATGKLGVAITSTGTGAGNAAGAIVEAQTAGTPLLHITGQIDSAFLDQGRGYIHEARDQFAMLRAISKEAFRVRTAASLPSVIQAAIRTALTAPMGVVSVEIPINFQKALSTPPRFQVLPPLAQPPDPMQVAWAAQLLRSARRPLIWAGSGVIASGAEAELTELAETLGAAVLTSQAGRGAIPEDHPQCIGFFGNNPALKDFLQSCDLLLAVGTKLRGQETNQWRLPLPALQVQLDVDPLAIGRGYPASAGIVADAKPGLQALLELLRGKTDPGPAFLAEVREARQVVRAALRQTLGPYEQIVDELRATLDHDGILVRDITISSSTWGNKLFEIYAPRHSIHASGGGIGQGWQMALGVKLGQPDKQVVVLCGDGGFLVNCGEMATAAQEKIPVVALLFNDGGYGVIRNIQNKHYAGRTFGVELQAPDFLKLAEAFGLNGYRVRALEEFRPALVAALASGQPSLIEIDMAAIGPFAVPFAGPATEA
jgi:acetolactate synthase I/II/III large subunit